MTRLASSRWMPRSLICLCALLTFSYEPLYARSADSEHLCFGYPSKGRILQRQGYIACYNSKTKVPDWTSYHLKSEYLVKNASRKDDFRADQELKEGERAELPDYKGTKFDRGHLVPAGDMSRSEKVMSESFLLSNMAPQHAPFNRGIWRELEARVRKWAKQKRNVHVLTGPLYLDSRDEAATHFQHLGGNKVAIPTHFYKIVVASSARTKDIDAIAFVLPNKNYPSSKLPSFISTIDFIEEKSGLDFLPDLDDNYERKLESHKATKLW